MIIPIEVIYTTSGKGKQKTRNVICAIYPTVLAQAVNYYPPEPIVFEVGDIMVEWGLESPGYRYYLETHYDN